MYRGIYETRSDAAADLATDIGAWSGIVVARLATTDRLPNGGIFLRPGADLIGQMDGVGWYPNPVNPGDTSMGDASIERWWDGGDWTERVRIRDGRGWSEMEHSLFTMPSN